MVNLETNNPHENGKRANRTIGLNDTLAIPIEREMCAGAHLYTHLEYS